MRDNRDTEWPDDSYACADCGRSLPPGKYICAHDGQVCLKPADEPVVREVVMCARCKSAPATHECVVCYRRAWPMMLCSSCWQAHDRDHYPALHNRKEIVA